ncbi:hypothetical protein JXA48_00540 [Candidatus Woesearchaeota archaeon]|nr:hypothetical protein [Candidatus Woesearchaeota archaeon]
MNTQKISQYFFIIAAVISILDGAFTLDETMNSVKIMFLLVAGTLVGILRHDEKEKEFILAGVAVIFTGLIFTQLMGTYQILENFALMIVNFVIFLSTAVIVVGIEIIAEIVAIPHNTPKVPKTIEEVSEEELKKLAFQKIWGTVILVAVALTFILLLAESFFDVGAFENIILVLDGAITVLFIVDLIILYNDSKNFGDFVKNNIFDIIASIPTVGILRALKLFRAIKIIKLMKIAKVTKATKFSKLYKTGKFFSEESYFNKVNDGSLDAKTKAVKKAVVKKKVAKKAVKKATKTSKKTNSKKKR